ncbi:hypothetical protein HA402_002737 [Bradysia odoriphaga]|nr:hypothetical protein HA402_002737 [Bradysia odoriphaga]
MTSLSQSFANLKDYLPFASTDSKNYRSSKSKLLYESLDPEVGFRLKLIPGNQQKASSSSDSYNGPELVVHIIGARHLPSIFGLKRVEGYAMKVKLFPGTLRFDTTIQTSSWPTFNETFKFPLESTTKSSFKFRSKSTEKIDQNQSLPEKLFKGHFVVITVFALLDLPLGARSSVRLRLEKIRRKSANLLQDSGKTDKNKKSEAPESDIMKLTTSETRRNVGSVTYFLDPKIFDENRRNGNYETDEFWLPIKDISVSSTAQSTSVASVNSSPKGQVELILQICEADLNEDEETNDTADSSAPSANKKDEQKRRLSFNDVKNRLKNLNLSKKEKYRGMCLKVTTSKMRCSIKVKEEFENFGDTVYVKTTIFEHDILSSAWKSNDFAPSLSTRWNTDNSTIVVPIVNEASLDYISIKVSVATKTKVGKKIFLGTLTINHKTGDNHWHNMLADKGLPVPMWHNFQ